MRIYGLLSEWSLQACLLPSLGMAAFSDPPLRASSEHILIVRTLRIVDCTGFPNLSFSYLSPEGGLFGLQLRASNEGLPRPRVARARETNRLPSPSIDCPFPLLL